MGGGCACVCALRIPSCHPIHTMVSFMQTNNNSRNHSRNHLIVVVEVVSGVSRLFISVVVAGGGVDPELP